MRFSTPHGFYELNQFPGCNQIVVSNHSWISPEHRGNGYGRLAHKARLEHIANLGYDYVMCTVRDDNRAQIHILETSGWKKLDTFFNKETEHTVHIYGKGI